METLGASKAPRITGNTFGDPSGGAHSENVLVLNGFFKSRNSAESVTQEKRPKRVSKYE